MKRNIIIALMLLTAACGAYAQTAGTAIVAHRGYWNCEEAGFSQNSIASLSRAQEAGFWGSECDVHLTSDGIIVVNHDDSFVEKSMVIREHTYEELLALKLPNGESIPTFDSYLDQFAKGEGTHLVIEFKEADGSDVVEKVLDALKAHDLFDPARICFISFSHDACVKVASLAPGFDVQFLALTIFSAKSPRKLKAEGINGINYEQRVYSFRPALVRKAHELGMKVNVWTVNKPSAMEKLISKGVDLITTNEPMTLRQILGDKEVR